MELSRRAVLCAALPAASQSTLRNATSAVDHLVVGTRDLDDGAKWIEAKLGVKPAAGGVHPGRGTRNSLLGLGKRQYLELIAPDPAQTSGGEDIVAKLRGLGEPQLIGWAASTSEAAALVVRLQKAGQPVMGPVPGSRKRPDGRMLEWQSVAVSAERFSVVPFFIQWAAGSVHPSEDSPQACRLQSVGFLHPRPEEFRAQLARWGIEGDVQHGSATRITAEIETPKGLVRL
jgi:hypothetical protein